MQAASEIALTFMNMNIYEASMSKILNLFIFNKKLVQQKACLTTPENRLIFA